MGFRPLREFRALGLRYFSALLFDMVGSASDGVLFCSRRARTLNSQPLNLEDEMNPLKV